MVRDRAAKTLALALDFSARNLAPSVNDAPTVLPAPGVAGGPPADEPWAAQALAQQYGWPM